MISTYNDQCFLNRQRMLWLNFDSCLLKFCADNKFNGRILIYAQFRYIFKIQNLFIKYDGWHCYSHAHRYSFGSISICVVWNVEHDKASDEASIRNTYILWWFIEQWKVVYWLGLLNESKIWIRFEKRQTKSNEIFQLLCFIIKSKLWCVAAISRI